MPKKDLKKLRKVLDEWAKKAPETLQSHPIETRRERALDELEMEIVKCYGRLP